MTHKIIDSNVTPAGNVQMTVSWWNGETTTETYSLKTATILGYRPVDPPATPAWMVEVVREACAMRAEANGEVYTARRYRDGAYDSGDNQGDIAAIIAALRLALERGHVVEAPVSVLAEPAVDWEEALKRAWDAGADAMAGAVARVYSEAKGSNADRLADYKRAGVARLLSSLPTREA